MPGLRYFFLLLAVLVGSGFAVNPLVRAAGPPVWRPYRAPLAPSVLVQPLPAECVIEVPAEGLPIDALTDYELNQMSAAYCEPTPAHGAYFDPVLGAALDDPVLAANHSNDTWQLLPGDLIWHSYFAGAKEPRFSGTFVQETNGDVSLLDATLGGRTSVLRHGWYQNGRPLGWELQLEGAAMLRLNLDENHDFDSTDFRFGIPLIYAPNELLHWKFAYYHLSAHVGDEFLVRNPGFQRINFSRDVLTLAASLYPRPAWRWYGEVGWAFHQDGGSEQWELQFGLDYAQPGPTGGRGTPFAAFNTHLREELDFGGNLVVQAGWLWRGRSGKTLRTGLNYYNGKSPQFEFFDNFEQQIGYGLWHEY